MNTEAASNQELASSLTLHVVDISALQLRADCLALPFARWFIWQLLGSKDLYGFSLGGSLVPPSVVAGLLELTDEKLLQRCCNMIAQSRSYARLDSKDGLGITVARDICYYHFGCENETFAPKQAAKVLVTASAIPVVCPELPGDHRTRTITFEQAVAGANGIMAATSRCRDDLQLYCRVPHRKFLPLIGSYRGRTDTHRVPESSTRKQVTLVCSPFLSGQLTALPLLFPAKKYPAMDLRILGGSQQLHNQLRHAQRTRQLDGIDLFLRSDWSPREIDHALQTSRAVILLSYYDELAFLEPHARACGTNVLNLSVEVGLNGQAAASYSPTEEHSTTLSEWLMEAYSLEDQRSRQRATVEYSPVSPSEIEVSVRGNGL
jgi:hypothetical protein